MKLDVHKPRIVMSLHCGRGVQRSGGAVESGLSPTPYTMGSDGEGDVVSPPARYPLAAGPGLISLAGGRAALISSPIVHYSRSGSRCDLSPGPNHEEYTDVDHRVRPRSGLYRYGRPGDFSPIVVGRDDSCLGRDDSCMGRNDSCAGQNDTFPGREDCCTGRDEQLMLSSSSDKDDSAYHEPLYYNCGSSPSGQDEPGMSGFYQVQQQRQYEVGPYILYLG